MKSRDPEDATRIILEYEDGTQLPINDLNQEHYEQFLKTMINLVQTYSAALQSLQQNTNSDEDRESDS